MKEIRQDYEETIHLLIPETFEKKWVKNIEKKGKLVWWKYFSLLNIGTSFNLFVSTDTSGGYMEWNINSDKLIFEWLANRTPTSCIWVKILSMAMATNPNSEVVKMIPCIKYIKNICSALSLLTKWLASMAIGNSFQVSQLHSDATSHKGTYIMNVILGVLTNNKNLITIYVAGDIIPEDGTAECQSAAIVDQFTEFGRLIKGWREKTIEIYSNDTDIDDLITAIPRKEDLCVSHTLGATMSADNCSAAQFCQSSTSDRIIELSRVNGITDKDKLIH